jgi:hypothetical protein
MLEDVRVVVVLLLPSSLPRLLLHGLLAALAVDLTMLVPPLLPKLLQWRRLPPALVAALITSSCWAAAGTDSVRSASTLARSMVKPLRQSWKSRLGLSSFGNSCERGR